MYRILIITDDHRLASPLAGTLAGSNVISTVIGTDLVTTEEVMARGGPDAVILDTRTAAPVEAFIRTVREQFSLDEVPIVGILPAEALSDLPLPALDDFVLDPFVIPELTARVLTRLSRYQALEGGNVVRVGRLEVDIDNYKARIGKEALDLTYKEFELLRFLITHRGRVFTREALLNRVWGYDYFGGARTVDVHIRRLRSKLGAFEDYIETVRSVGYRFSEES